MADSTTDQNRLTIEEIISLLRKAHASQLQKAWLTSIFIFVGIQLLGISLFILFDSLFYFSAAAKTGIVGILLILAFGTGFHFYRKPHRLSFHQFYRKLFESVDRKQVHSAVDLHLNPDHQKSKFYLAAIQANLRDLNAEDFKTEISTFTRTTSIAKSFNRFGTIAGTGLILFTVVGMLLTGQSKRSLTFWETFSQPNPYTFTVAPGDTTVEHGSTIQPEIQFNDSSVPNELYLAFKTDVEEEFRIRPLRQLQSGQYIADELELTNSITFQFEMDGFKSDAYRIDVRLQPRFDELIVSVVPPSYTLLPERRFEYPYSEINFYPGSEITVEGNTNKPVQSAQIQYNGEWFPIQRESKSNQQQFSFEFTPTETDTLIFKLEDQDGLQNRNPFSTRLTLREDEYPAVSILEPTGTILETAPGSLSVFYQATDDFGLTSAELRYELQRAFVDEPIRGDLQLERPRNGRTESVNWDLTDLDLKPRDEVNFFIRVSDNDAISGYKWSESQTVTLQIPSLADYFEDLDGQERDVQNSMDDVSENFNQMEQEYREFLERLRENPEGGYEEQQIMEEIQQRQEQIDESVQKMNEQFEQIRSEIQQNDRTSEETRQAYRELQQLMDELDDPALREAMEQMQQALESMSPQEIERALENMDFNEELYRERLQRTAELFKRLKMNSDLDKLANQYEDLAERASSQPDQSLSQLMNELESIREDFSSLERQLEELDRNPPKRSEETLRDLKQQAQERLKDLERQLDELQQDAEESSGNSGEQPSDAIQQQQDQISEQLQEEAEKFRSSVQQMGGSQLQVNILALQRVLYTLLELSSQQEYLTKTVSETRSQSQGFVDLARSQKNVSDQFEIVSDTLLQVSSEIPSIPNQVNRKKSEVQRTLGRAMDEMIERNQRGSSITSRESLGGINDLTSLLASLIDQLMNQQGGGSGGGMSMQQMIEQMQEMSGDQMQLNQQLQDMINDIQGDRLSQEESERLDQLARQQNDIRRQLQELQRRGALDPGDRSLSEMERMIEEMEESINDLRGGLTDPIMVQRQQNILSRMLETEESLQQRGESEEREGTDPDNYDRTLPPDMTLEELQQEIRSRLQDPNYTRFTEEYQQLIEQYFEQLRRFEDRPVPQ